MARRDQGLVRIEPISSSNRSIALDLDLDAPTNQGGTPLNKRPNRDAGMRGDLARMVVDPEMAQALKVRMEAPSDARLTIERDEESGRMVVKLVDPRTEAVIRQIPPDEMLRIAHAMDRYLGLLVDKQS